MMMTLAVAAIALGAIRVFVVVEVALQRYAAGFTQAGAIALFALICLLSAAPALRIAELYAVVTLSFMVIVAIALIMPRARGYPPSFNRRRDDMGFDIATNELNEQNPRCADVIAGEGSPFRGRSGLQRAENSHADGGTTGTTSG